MALRRLAPRFVDWRLSRIDEEVDRQSCSSGGSTPPSPPLPPPPPLLLDDDPAAVGEASPPPSPVPSGRTSPTPGSAGGDPAVIYSNANEWRKQQLERSAANDEREALRFIREKYDSLGKIAVDRPGQTVAETAASNSPQPDDEGSAAVYENVSRASQVEEGGQNSSPDVDATDGAALKPSAQHTCTCSRQLRREMVQRQVQHLACQHQQQQRQRALQVECIPRTPLSDAELIQVDLFYRSYRSSVYVCTCMATLSFSRPVHTPSAGGKSRPAAQSDDHDDGVWACVRTGIPVVVKDSGGGRRRRRVYVLLVERGTGFELWRAPLDRLSDYTVTAAVIPSSADQGASSVTCSQHTMRLSVDNTVSVTARLAFDDQPGADEFHRQLVRLASADGDDAPTAAPVGGGGSQAGCGGKKRRRKGAAPISKSDISQPCCFSHVTRLERGIPCRGRPGLHIIVASGRQIDAAAQQGSQSHSPTSNCTSRTAAGQCHCSFKANHV